MPNPNDGEEALSIRYDGQNIKVIGETNSDEFIESHDVAVCVPLTDTGMVILILEPSPAHGQEVLLLPGGIIEKGEVPDAAANRELQEEIGYRAKRLDYLGTLRPWEKYLRGQVVLYLARDLVVSRLHGDEIYDISTYLVPLNDFERLIKNKRLYDATVVAALYMARQRLSEEADLLEA